ncbi:mitochondrial carrier [Colletotrichum incanum]|uniref:Mitochondrial carrier n=1 Tax=Colletotrichum incanum TaxID=1573173 RepID=A0A166QXZ8_COLIC|nr:mitochondrial carrier [Colletotrichum incanum]
MAKISPASESEASESEASELAPAQPSDPQEQSPFFKLPWDIRMDIYDSAYPRIHLPQLIYIDVNGRASCNEVGDSSCVKGRLCRVVCNGLFEDNGAEIRARRATTYHAASSIGSELTLNRHKQRYRRPHDELVYPLPLLLACRRMYEDVAPHCDQSFAFQDFLALEAFFDKVSGKGLANDLTERLNKVSLDFKFSSNDAFKPSSRKKILPRWAAACKMLATWRSMQSFRLRVEIPLSQQKAIPGNIHVSFIRELGQVATHAPDIEVRMMLTSRAHPRSATTRVYKLGISDYHSWDYGFEVPGWRTKQIKGCGLDEDLGMLQKYENQ